MDWRMYGELTAPQRDRVHSLRVRAVLKSTPLGEPVSDVLKQVWKRYYEIESSIAIQCHNLVVLATARGMELHRHRANSS